MLPVSDMREVHEWFLHRGLPLVLTRRVRSRALIERSAPMVSGVGAVISLTMMLAELTNGDPDFGYVIRLGVLTLLLIAAPFALYLLHQAGTTLGDAGRRSAALLVMALFVFGLPFAASGFSGIAAAEAFGLAIVAVLAIWLTYVGFGSIALWAFRFAWVQVGALGTLMSRALPLLMITVVVYFTGELWQLAARMTRQRLWQTIGFLAVVAIIFVITTIRDEVLALRDDRAEQSDPAELLEGTPLATRRATNRRAPHCRWRNRSTSSRSWWCHRRSRWCSSPAGCSCSSSTLGIVAMPDDVAVLWSAEETCPVGEPPCPGTWFGIHVPLPQTIVHISLVRRGAFRACTSPSAQASTRFTGSGSSTR